MVFYPYNILNLSLLPCNRTPEEEKRNGSNFKQQLQLFSRQMALRRSKCTYLPLVHHLKAYPVYIICIVYTCTYGYNTYIDARTCCNAANPSFCHSQLMGGRRMIASSTFRLLSTNSHTRRRNLERGLRARSSFWSRICTYLRVCRQLSIACPTVIFLDKSQTIAETPFLIK